MLCLFNIRIRVCVFVRFIQICDIDAGFADFNTFNDDIIALIFAVNKQVDHTVRGCIGQTDCLRNIQRQRITK